MESPLQRPRFSLDLLIAEAKRRMRRRRVLVALAVLAVAAVVLAWQPWGGGQAGATSGQGITASHTPIAAIPGMTRTAAWSERHVLGTCDGGTFAPPYPGWHGHIPVPAYCSVLKPVGGWGEQWILTSAYNDPKRFRYNVTLPFAEAHPGPVLVRDSWIEFASPAAAQLYLREPDLAGSGHPVWALHGGVAAASGETGAGLAQVGTPKRRVEQRQKGLPGRSIGFTWASGANVVDVSVEGVGLTVQEAQQIALLAAPR